MKHAGNDSLDRLEPLLSRLREFPELREKKRGVFYPGARAFLHFHEDPDGDFADLRAGEEFVRLPVNSERQRVRVIGEVARALRN